MKIKFQRSRKIRMSGPRRGQSLARILGPVDVFYGKRLLPIWPIAILDAYRNRRSNRPPVSHPGQNIGPIFFDALAAAAPKSELAAMQFAIYERQVNGDASRQAGHPGDQRLSV